MFAVIGPNGAGKTTLFNAISGFFPPTEGRIAFDGDDITGLPQRKIAARGLVRTYQLVQLFKDLTVAENVQVGFHLVTKGAIGAALLRPRWMREQEARIRAETRELLAFVGLAAQADMRADTLPYGRQRLLEVARALAAQPAAAAARRAGRRAEPGRDRRRSPTPSCASATAASRCC